MSRIEIPMSVLIAVMLVLGVGILAFSGTLGSITGFGTLSLSKVDFLSNDPSIGGQAWLVSVVQNGAGQELQGTFTSSQLQVDDKKPQSDLTISMTMDKNFLEYPITNIKQSLFYIETLLVPSGQNVETWCNQQSSYQWVKPQYSFNNYCLRKSNIGTAGLVGVGTNFFQSTIRLRSSTKAFVQEGIINNFGQTSIKIGDVAFATWQGSLVTGEQFPDASKQDVCALWYGEWHLTSCSQYAKWRGSLDSQNIPSCITGRDEPGFLTCISDTNNIALTAAQDKSFVSSGGASATSIGDLDSGKTTIQLAKQFTLPLITMHVKADWLGIYIAVGQPKIISASSSEFKTGATGSIKARIRNIGDGRGTFDTSASCPAPFSATGVPVRSTLDPGLETDVFLTLTADVQSLTSSTCTVTTIDVNNPSKTDSFQVAVSATNIIICDPGQKRTYGLQIQQCNSSGSNWDVIETCTGGKIPDPVTFTCKAVDGGGGNGNGECAFWDIPCQISGAFEKLFNAIVIILGLVLAIVIAIVIIKFKR